MTKYKKVKKVCIVCGTEIESGRYCAYHQEQSDKAKKLADDMKEMNDED